MRGHRVDGTGEFAAGGQIVDGGEEGGFVEERLNDVQNWRDATEQVKSTCSIFGHAFVSIFLMTYGASTNDDVSS